MATRRRRPTAAKSPVSEESQEITHEEMLEVANEREEELAIEALMAAALADTFEALQKAEEEKGLDDFFDPSFYEQEVRHPAPGTSFRPAVPPPAPEPRPRLIVRNNTRRRKG